MQKPWLSKSKETFLENDFGKSESHLLEYNLSKSLKVAVKRSKKQLKFDFLKCVYFFIFEASGCVSLY